MIVLVTVADNGVKHVWGPYETRGKAMTQVRRFEREASEHGWAGQVTYSIHKVLPAYEPVEVKG